MATKDRRVENPTISGGPGAIQQNAEEGVEEAPEDQVGGK